MKTARGGRSDLINGAVEEGGRGEGGVALVMMVGVGEVVLGRESGVVYRDQAYFHGTVRLWTEKRDATCEP